MSALHAKTYRGTIRRQKIWKGSKSEHNALVLQCNSGDFKLRRKGGNAFADPILDELENKTIECMGIVRGRVLIMEKWKMIR
jgi:hypothetical protein